MKPKSQNSNLHKAKTAKNDEFYTQIADIENELKHYKNHFKDKVVYCNCDDPRISNFFRYFAMNFKFLGLKKLISSCYKSMQPDLFSQYDSEQAIYLKYNGEFEGNMPDVSKTNIQVFESDGDFRNRESVELLKQADIVVTNPPFSLFREYVGQLIEYDKKFIILGNINALTYKEIFSLVKENRIWLGYNTVRWFEQPNGELFETARTYWFTNLEHKKRNEELFLFKKYNEVEYPKYDNYNAINVDKTTDIPCDYKGKMGVPITFLDKYNPNQFEILALGIVGSCEFTKNRKMEILDSNGVPTGKFTYNAKGTLYTKYNPERDKKPAFRDCETGELYKSIYARVIIKNKQL